MTTIFVYQTSVADFFDVIAQLRKNLKDPLKVVSDVQLVVNTHGRKQINMEKNDGLTYSEDSDDFTCFLKDGSESIVEHDETIQCAILDPIGMAAATFSLIFFPVGEIEI